MLEVRRTEPGRRSGAGPAEQRGGPKAMSFKVVPSQKRTAQFWTLRPPAIHRFRNGPPESAAPEPRPQSLML